MFQGQAARAVDGVRVPSGRISSEVYDCYSIEGREWCVCLKEVLQERDRCCQPLAEACRSKGLDAATVVAMLSALDSASYGTSTNADAMTLSEVCDHIEEVHHAYLREALPRLDFMTRKVAAGLMPFSLSDSNFMLSSSRLIRTRGPTFLGIESYVWN